MAKTQDANSLSKDAGDRRPCPICAKPAQQAHAPFCSKRCADVDLHRWLGGRYAIPGEPAKDEAILGGEADE